VRVLTAAEAREMDRRASTEIGLPPLLLMENAAIGAADAVGDRFPEARRVLILAGPGNNGGDGLALARQLDARGYDVGVRLARFGRGLSSEAAAQREILARLGVEVVELAPEGVRELELALARADLIVDALFGVGLSRPLAGEAAELVSRIRASGRPVLALDLPSGLDADRSASPGAAVRATVTVTFGAPKPALVLPPACDFAGDVVVADLGLRIDPGEGPGALHLLVGGELAAALVPRPAAGHKGTFGHALVVAGSRGKLGALVLATRAAVVGGAGLTTAAVPAGLDEALAAACPEAMTLPLPATAGGELALDGLEMLVAAARSRSVLAVGPGLGRREETAELVRRLLAETSVPAVVDADALVAYGGRLAALADREAPTLLTPHPGEMARLLGVDTADVQRDRLGAARRAARESGAIVVLKGQRTIVAAPDGEAWVNATGNAGMASGGSGDVLTGILAARLAQGDAPAFAAVLSVHLHGLAGDLALARLGGVAVPAGELLASWGDAWAELVDA
jgi:ADP-dependent NAD(P)H-hydrate dehydratase / NAD(P)H-hydrate epimerase